MLVFTKKEGFYTTEHLNFAYKNYSKLKFKKKNILDVWAHTLKIKNEEKD